MNGWIHVHIDNILMITPQNHNTQKKATEKKSYKI